MSDHKSLAAALAAFQAEAPTFPKTKTAKVQTKTGGSYSYTYADLGDILPVVGPLLAKHGLSWSSKPVCTADGELALRYTLRHASDQEDTGEMPLGVDKRCKPQELGSAITYARRYALTAQLNLATDEDDDGRGAQQAERQPQTRRPEQPRQSDEAATTPEDIAHIKAAAKGLSGAQIRLQFGQVGLLPPAPETPADRLFDRVPKAKAQLLAEVLAGVER